MRDPASVAASSEQMSADQENPLSRPKDKARDKPQDHPQFGTQLNAQQLVAHRGWQRRYPENTLLAVEAAIAAGATNVEVDMQLSADQQPMLFHEPCMRRLCGHEGEIFAYTQAELAQFSAAEAGRFGQAFGSNRITPLRDVVETLRSHPQVDLYLEIKVESLERFGRQAVLDAVFNCAAEAQKQIVLISFDLEVLLLARQQGWSRFAYVLPDWQAWQHPALPSLKAEGAFCDTEFTPSDIDLSQLPLPVVMYEVGNSKDAQAWLHRGAAKIETYAIGELLQVHG